MDDLLKALPSLIGVVIGGLITFFIQRSTIKKQQKWDREKLRIDNFYKSEAEKFKTYNKILEIDATVEIHHHYDSIEGGYRLDLKKYFTYVRPLLFEIFHLLDDEVATEVNKIEYIFEREYMTGEEQPSDKKNLSDSYLKIIKLIKQQFKEYRKSNANLTLSKTPKKKWKWNSWLVYSEEERKEIEEHRQKKLNS
ncbi:hypothetical protein ACJEBK_19690 [Peribacillus frigoritolerans]|uniref:hypothetical protein n=1 Tax=Peribacillus frigoritolerans TaxID=450367 RepID=UPI0038723A1E